MALQLASAGARIKAFIPTLLGLTARAGKTVTAPERPGRSNGAERIPAQSSAPIILLSPEAKAALAPLDLPPDGPIDPGAILRPRLTPDVAARNFVSWARALDLTGHYSKRSIYALYCEFSEVDERPPVGDTRFLAALAQADGISKQRRRWQWTIEPAQEAQTVEAPAADTRPAPALCAVLAAPDPVVIPEPPASLLMPPKSARAAIVLPRFVSDADHPFSPAGLREGEKSARRLRLNAAASRKQRGGVRRAA